MAVGLHNQQGHPPARQEEPLPAHSFLALLRLLLAVAGGTIVAVLVMPSVVPGLSLSLTGPEPKAYWYLARASAVVAYSLLWLAMIFGLLITSRTARLWPGGPLAFGLHQHLSVLALALTLFHALVLTGDRFIAFSLAQIIIPFSSPEYRPLWVGLGQVDLYLIVVLTLSFSLRHRIGRRTWRLVHYLSFVAFALALIHGLTSGTDSDSSSLQALYIASGSSLGLLLLWRLWRTRGRAIDR